MTECIAGHFDVLIARTRGPYGALVDASSWMQASGYAIPEVYELRVYMPEAGIDTTVLMPTHGYLSAAPSISGRLEDIPDGMIRLSTTSCGKEYTVTKIYAANLRYKIDLMIADALTERARSLATSLDNQFTVMESLVSAGRLEEAASYYRQIADQVKRKDGERRFSKM